MRCATDFARFTLDSTFVMPNAWDIGSARVMESLGFASVATTSSGHAASLGRVDQRVSRDELIAHVEALAGAVDVPLNVDAESCFADASGGIAETVRLVARDGAAGISVEDYDAGSTSVLARERAVDAVRQAADAAREHGLVLTARAENHLYGIDDLDDTIARLRTYRDAGADVVYAPGLSIRQTSGAWSPPSTHRSTCSHFGQGRPSMSWRGSACDACRSAVDWHARRTGHCSPAPASSWTAEPQPISSAAPNATLADLFELDRS